MAAGRSSGAAVVVLVLLSQLVAVVVQLLLPYWRGKAPARGACHSPHGGCGRMLAIMTVPRTIRGGVTAVAVASISLARYNGGCT